MTTSNESVTATKLMFCCLAKTAPLLRLQAGRLVSIGNETAYQRFTRS
jgi:hypothetical protein